MKERSSGADTYPSIAIGVKTGWVAGAIMAALWAGFWCWMACLLPGVATASLPKALIAFLGSFGLWGSVLAVFAVAFLVFGGLAALRPSTPSKRKRWKRTVVLLLLAIGLLSTGYLAWARYRISGYVFVYDEDWPLPWPYPDLWLLDLNDWLDARNPSPPDTFKIHSEIPCVQMMLDFALAGSALLSSACLSPFVISRLQRSADRHVSARCTRA